jgi:hypothetical protein
VGRGCPSDCRLGLFDEQGDVVVVSIIDVEKTGGESASAFRTNAGVTREPIARCTPAGRPKRRRGGQVAASLRLRLAVRERATPRAVRSRVVQSRASVFASGALAHGGNPVVPGGASGALRADPRPRGCMGLAQMRARGTIASQRVTRPRQCANAARARVSRIGDNRRRR